MNFKFKYKFIQANGVAYLFQQQDNGTFLKRFFVHSSIVLGAKRVQSVFSLVYSNKNTL